MKICENIYTKFFSWSLFAYALPYGQQEKNLDSVCILQYELSLVTRIFVFECIHVTQVRTIQPLHQNLIQVLAVCSGDRLGPSHASFRQQWI